MRIPLQRLAGPRAFGLGASLTVTVLLAAGAARAQTPYTGTGWVYQVALPGIWCTNAQGQVGMRGNAHLVRVECSDPRATGRRTIFVNGAAQADGSALIYGAAYQEVGIWDLTNPATPKFTPTGGMWETSHRGTMGADGSLELHIVGNGWGGAIDGLRVEETLKRGPGPILDPTIPYNYTGTIKPPPLNTVELVSDFSQPFAYPKYGSGTCFNQDGQFHATGSFKVRTRSFDTFVLGQQCALDEGWSLANGTTLDWRADLVHLDDNATNCAQLAVSANYAPGYCLNLNQGGDLAFMMKWSALDADYRILWCERLATPLPHSNVTLAVALTRQDPNAVITARVLDKADPSKVLFTHSYVDTPTSDPTLTGAEFEALTGMQISGLSPDAVEPPPTKVKVGALLGLFQYTDGKQPAPAAVWGNLELRTSEIPILGIEGAVRISWPGSATLSYAIQGAPTVQGPWLPVEDQTVPGFQNMTVPANDFMRVFRAVQSP